MEFNKKKFKWIVVLFEKLLNVVLKKKDFIKISRIKIYGYVCIFFKALNKKKENHMDEILFFGMVDDSIGFFISDFHLKAAIFKRKSKLVTG